MSVSIKAASARLLVAATLLLAQAVLGLASISRALSADADPGLASLVICHGADPNSAPDTPTPPHQHDLDCDLCALCQAPATVAVLPDPSPAPPAAPVVLVSGSVALPPARAPPRTPLLASAFPTGPPLLA